MDAQAVRHTIPAEWLKAAGMQNFRPLRTSYRCDDPNARLIRLADIEKPPRDADVLLDANGFGRDRMLRLLIGIRNDDDIPPVELKEGGPPFRVHHGFHRFYASLTVGFSHIPVVIA